MGAWKGPVVEDALDALVQACRFWLLALRVAARQLQRLVRSQASRLLTREKLAELRKDCIRCLRAVSGDPVGSSKVFASHAVSSARWIGKKLPQWYANLPRFSVLFLQ